MRLGGVAVACCLLTIFAVAVKPVTDPDFFWHLATGRYMVAHHVIPHHDVFSLTAQSHVWITHEWVTELLFYGGWVLGGTALLSLAAACVITATFALVYAACRERGAPQLVSAAIVGLAALASAHTWGVRPQMLSLLLTAVYGLALTRMVARQQTAPPLWLCLVMMVWVNLHGGFIFGLALLASVTVSYVAQDRWRARQSGPSAPETAPRPPVNAGRCGLVLALAALATLVNPNGLAGALYPVSYLGNNASTRYIAEWVSPDFHQTQYLLFEALVLALLVGALASAKRAHLVDYVVVLPFLYLAFQSVRNISLFAVLGAPIAAELVGASVPWRKVASAGPRTAPRGRSVLNWIAVVVIGAGIISTTLGKLTQTAQARAVSKMYPAAALRYIEAHGLPARGFDSYNWGGFLIWNWFPGRLVFVDGRPDMYGDAFMDRYVRAYKGESSWRALFAVNHLCYALVEATSGIAAALKTDRAWMLVYHDRESVLFERAGLAGQCR